MEELLYKTTFWISRVYELTAYRYTERSQSLMLFSDRSFELRWVDYAQNSALVEFDDQSEPPLPNSDVHICLSGTVSVINTNTLELTPTRKFLGADETTLDARPFRCFIAQSVLTVDSPLQKEQQFNQLAFNKPK